ncbi:repressor [Candidatus Williamhamiltonella defendens]|uniref:Repressor n=2 Tax=Candidatus Williamhamiltonella defendens TaxID=138072 RepID=A0A2D3TFV9_9ENTR|nr:repressor [Candidatus Hamiltonella defensa]
MPSEYGKKLKDIRHAEGLTQPEFSALTGISLGAIRNYETGQSGVGLNVIDKIVKHPKLNKYTMWLMSDKTAPNAGQIQPAFSLSGSEVSEEKKDQRKSFHTKENDC